MGDMMENKKTDVFDYLDWRGELSFQQSGFNEIDALILSIFAYLDFSCTQGERTYPFVDAINIICTLPDEVKYDGPNIIMHSVVELASKASFTKRFCNMKIAEFVDITNEEREIQFAAITFLLPDDTVFISFRGTDNTLVGWKEDFNMSFIDGTPSQLEATKYVENLLANLEKPIRLGGHSKGGNLAIWAGAHQKLEYKNRIIQIYSNDGPGFSENFLNSSIYQDIRGKILSFVPESSIVGVLMEHDHYITILSKFPTILQHDPFSWIVLGSHFIYENDRTISGMHFERIINSWIRAMSPQEREEFVENVYDIIIASNAKTLEDLDKNKLKSLFLMSKTFREMGVKKQAQLLISLSKVVFNSDILVNGNILNLLPNRVGNDDIIFDFSFDEM
jgi:hypothetical protein